jgi:hypothetical protein
MTTRLVLISSLLVACGGGGTDSTTDGPIAGNSNVACTYPPGAKGPGTACAEYKNSASGQASAEKQACTTATPPGTVSDSCSTTNLLGCCTMTSGGFQIATCSYSDSGSTAAMEQGGCSAAGGTWSTSP